MRRKKCIEENHADEKMQTKNIKRKNAGRKTIMESDHVVSVVCVFVCRLGRSGVIGPWSGACGICSSVFIIFYDHDIGRYR